jgi:hypothetical protein
MRVILTTSTETLIFMQIFRYEKQPAVPAPVTGLGQQL